MDRSMHEKSRRQQESIILISSSSSDDEDSLLLISSQPTNNTKLQNHSEQHNNHEFGSEPESSSVFTQLERDLSMLVQNHRANRLRSRSLERVISSSGSTGSTPSPTQAAIPASPRKPDAPTISITSADISPSVELVVSPLQSSDSGKCNEEAAGVLQAPLLIKTQSAGWIQTKPHRTPLSTPTKPLQPTLPKQPSEEQTNLLEHSSGEPDDWHFIKKNTTKDVLQSDADSLQKGSSKQATPFHELKRQTKSELQTNNDDEDILAAFLSPEFGVNDAPSLKASNLVSNDDSLDFWGDEFSQNIKGLDDELDISPKKINKDNANNNDTNNNANNINNNNINNNNNNNANNNATNNANNINNNNNNINNNNNNINNNNNNNVNNNNNTNNNVNLNAKIVAHENEEIDTNFEEIAIDRTKDNYHAKPPAIEDVPLNKPKRNFKPKAGTKQTQIFQFATVVMKTPEQPQTAPSLGFRLPDSIDNVLISRTSFDGFTKDIFNCSLVSVGAIFTGNITNFRPPTNSKTSPQKKAKKCLGWAFATGKNYYFLSFHAEAPQVPPKERYLFILKFLQSNSIEKVTYEWKELIKSILPIDFTIQPKKIFDIKIALWMLRPEEDAYGFVESLISIKAPVRDTDSAIHIISQDLANAFLLHTDCVHQLQATQIEKAFWNLEMKVVPVLSRMEFKGVSINISYLEENKTIIKKKLRELQDEAGDYGCLNLGSNQNVRRVIDAVIPKQQQKTKKKKKSEHESVDASVLEELAQIHPFPKLVLEYRHCAKILGTYIESYLERCDRKRQQETIGELRCEWLHTGTRTGRLSCQNPNLQNLPRGSLSLSMDSFSQSSQPKTVEHSISVRKCVTAPPGWSIVAFDYSQVETRILAHFSQDKHLLEFFESNQDIHRCVASRCFQKPRDEISSQEREWAKRIVYGLLYGMGPVSLQRVLNLSTIQEAITFQQKFLQSFPGVTQFISATKKQALKTGKSRTITNRFRLVPDIDHEDKGRRGAAERQAVNSAVQGSAADITKYAMLKADRFISSLEGGVLSDRVVLLMQIHDELVFQIHDNALDHALPKLQECMEAAYLLDGVALPTKCSIGPSFGDLKEINITNFLAERRDSKIRTKSLKTETVDLTGSLQE